MRVDRITIFCFAAVYVIWGSTYLAIAYAVQTIPPWTATFLRHVLAAALMVGIAALKREKSLSHAEIKIAIVSGGLLIFANGLVFVSEKTVPSGVVSVLCGAMPIWIMLLGLVSGRLPKPSILKGIGAFVGVGGIVMISSPHLTGASGGRERFGILILSLSCLSWATGSLYIRQSRKIESLFRFSAYQMLAGTIVTMTASIFWEKPWGINWAAVSYNSWLAIAYLAVFGTMIAFTAYSWLARNVEPHRLSTYALVNPVIAVGLGWFLLSEPVTGRFFVGTLFVLLGLFLLIRPERKAASLHDLLTEKKGARRPLNRHNF